MARIEQAGAIVVRPGSNEPRILLVTARRNPDNWIFPKGHVEDGEGLKAAALREAREEAGVVEAKVVAKAGSIAFDFGNNRYRVHYFIVRTSDRGREREGRRLRWLRYKQALRRLTYDETREILREAWPRIKVAIRKSSNDGKVRRARKTNRKTSGGKTKSRKTR